MFKTKKDLKKLIEALDKSGIVSAQFDFFSGRLVELKEGYATKQTLDMLVHTNRRIDMLFDYLNLEVKSFKTPILVKKKPARKRESMT